MRGAGCCIDREAQTTDYQIRGSSATYRAPRLKVSLADFDIICRIGDGSFSEVLHVRDKLTKYSYALKVVDKHLIVRHKMMDHIRQERNILDKCDYNGIVRLYFTFQDEANLYLGMELCHNGELYDQIRCAGHMPLSRAVFYAAEIVLMLEYLREERIVHRDLKPENLLLTKTGHLKLADFGSILVFSDEQEERREDQRSTSLVGTADYLAPEVLSNEPVTYALDLWALGCIIFQMLVGKAPFKAASEYLTYQLIADVKYKFPMVPEVPPVAQDLISQLLRVNPAERLGARDLEELQAHPFFDGVVWYAVRSGPAAPFTSPLHPQTDLGVGLDWEMSSMAASLPVAYQAHEGAPIYHTSGHDFNQYGYPPEVLPGSGFRLRTHSSLVSDVLRPHGSSASSSSHHGFEGDAAAVDGRSRSLQTGAELRSRDGVSCDFIPVHSYSLPEKYGLMKYRETPSVADEESAVLCDALRASAL